MRLLLALVASIVAGSVLASPTTYRFSGVVTENALGGVVGQTMFGSITVDPATFYLTTTDGSTYNFLDGTFFPDTVPDVPKQTDPLQVYGTATDGSASVATGGGSRYDYGELGVVRSNGGSFNSFDVFTKSVESDGSYSILGISIQDLLGATSDIFSAPAGDLSLFQNINWLASGATTLFTMARITSAGESIVNYRGYLTSVSVPEPGTIALVGLAMLGFVAIKKRKRTHTPRKYGLERPRHFL